MSSVPRVVLVVLDGFGERPETDGNAVRLARMPTFTKLYGTTRTASSAQRDDVGLPDGQMGNSEVGHLNFGAGRIVYQDIVRIDKAIKETRSTRTRRSRRRSTPPRRAAAAAPVRPDRPGDVHASLDHVYALLELAKRRGRRASRARVPGRARHAAQAARRATCATSEAPGRDRRRASWRRWSAATTRWTATSAGTASRWRGGCSRAARASPSTSGRRRRARLRASVTDEFVEPLVTQETDGAVIKDGDACFFFNFRADRARELTRAFHASDAEFTHFAARRVPSSPRSRA